MVQTQSSKEKLNSSSSNESDEKSRKKSESSPPVLKKSRTNKENGDSDSDSTTPHFPGPLFPAVRRISTSSPPPQRSSDLRVSVDNHPLHQQQQQQSNYGGEFSDRDWFYPSFVVPRAPKRHVHPSSVSEMGNNLPQIPPPPPASASAVEKKKKKQLKQQQQLLSSIQPQPQTHSSSSRHDSTRSTSSPTPFLKFSSLCVFLVCPAPSFFFL